jgi:tetratricopeptide (TPR) repeat protein
MKRGSTPRVPGWLILVVLLGSLAGSGGCARKGPPPQAVELSAIDCVELHAGGTCDVEAPQPLSILLPSASGTPRAVSWRTAAGVRPIGLGELRKTEAGTLLRVDTRGAQPGTLQVETDRGVATLALGVPQTPAELKAARALRAEGKLESAEAQLSALLVHRDAALKARARGLLARIRLSAGRIDEAASEFRAAIALAERAGLRTTAATDRIALGDTLRRRKFALDEARAVLRGVDGAVLDQRAWATFQLGIIEMVSGNARAALTTLRDAEQRGRALGLQHLAVASVESRAEVLSALGRHEEALASLAAIRPEVPAEPCTRARYLANLGWNQLSAALHGAASLDAAASIEAVGLYEKACPRRWNRDNALLNVAMARAFAGDAGQALAILERTRDGADPGFELEAFRKELEAQLMRDAGRPAEALAAYDQMIARAGSAAPIGFRYRAALGRALSLRALGRSRDAVAALGEAEAALDRQERLVPLGDERGSFLGFHQAASLELVDLLLTLGQNADALAAARRSRSRLLRSLARWGRLSVLDGAAQQRWEASLAAFRAARENADAHAARAWSVPASERAAYLARGDALANVADQALDQALVQIGERSLELDTPALPAGEALLTAHPVRGGWAVLVQFAGKVEVARLAALPAADPVAQSAALLEPFAATLARATTLRVLSGGELDDVAVHALPFGDGPLLAALPVVYALDLPAGPAPAALAPGDLALLVVDPRRDLPLAHEEARVASAALAQRAKLVSLAGRAATQPALLAQLPQARWFHYAGHAELSKRGMLESSLALAGGALPLSEVLALSRVPDVVVLSACEGALAFRASREPGAFASLGLAQAFVLGGARAVLATTAAVPDAVAQAMSTSLYASPFEGKLGAEEFRRAALALRERFPEQWWSFRLLIP